MGLAETTGVLLFYIHYYIVHPMGIAKFIVVQFSINLSRLMSSHCIYLLVGFDVFGCVRYQSTTGSSYTHMFIDARAELPTRTDIRWPFHFQEIRLYFPRNLSGQQAFSTVIVHYQQDPPSSKQYLLWSFYFLFWCVISSINISGVGFLSVNATFNCIRILAC